jgi:KDO2-lipid IV(A) lauroyltransferase
MQNLAIAFPEKTEKQRQQIAREFYRIFTDSIFEILKMLSISKDQLKRRVQMDLSVCDEVIAKGKNIHVLMGHQMNWEYGSLIFNINSSIPTIGVYQRISSRLFDRLMLYLRSRLGAKLVAAHQFSTEAPTLMKQQYALGLIADQSPPGGQKGYWLNFFSRPTPFIMGPEKGARRMNPAIVFLNCVQTKRGYYNYEVKLVAENGNEFNQGELARIYRDFLEESIRRNPANYLWTHRRWKHKYNPEWKKNWVDSCLPPNAENLSA